MRTWPKALIAALATAASGLTAGIGSGSIALAQTSASLPITSFDQIVADPAVGYLFISQGSSSSSENHILVTNFAGQEVTTIGGQDGVMGIALSPDGKTLYAALSAGHAVTAIDTATLKQTASYPVGDENTPEDLAVQSGKVWVSYNTATVGAAAAIGDISLTAATPAFETQAAMGGWYSAPQIAADPEGSGVLVAAEPGLDPSSVASYNVAVDPVTVRAQNTFFQGCENESDLAVVPGGSQFVLACGYPYVHYRYSTADLSQQGSYASTNYPDAVAIDASGDVAAGTANGVTTSPDIYVYQQGGDTPLNTFNLNSSGADLAARGLAWAPDGSKLFAVLSGYNGVTTGYTLQVIQDPKLVQPALTLTGPARAQVARSLILTGSLTLPGNAAPPAGATITIGRSEAGSATVKDFTVTTDAQGSFSLTDTPPGTGQYTYTANYGGTSAIAPATASWTVIITRRPATLSVTARPARATYEPTIRVTAHLGTTYTSRTVSIYALPFGSSSRILLKTARVNSDGNLTVSYRAAHSTRFRAVFGGDARYAPKTASRAVYVRARVSEWLSGNYRRKRIGGRTYLLFRRRKIMYAHARVAPGKRGECVKLDVQERYRGAWYGSVSRCFRLSRFSRVTVRLRLTHADIGYHYRIRADYIPGSDTSNLGNDSRWAYFIVER